MNEQEFRDVPSPYWIASIDKSDYPALDENITADVCIVGGGIVGISSAYLLAQAGLKVALIEANRILHGTTGHTTAKITSQHSLIYARLKQEIGEEKAHQYAQANESAIHMIAQMVEEKELDCDFTWLPAYVYTQSDQYVEKIEAEVKAAQSLGIKASYLQEIPLPFKVKAAMRFDNQAQFHPLKYLKHLAGEIINMGGQIFEQTQAVNIEHDPTYSVITRNGKSVHSPRVIIATHYPFFDGGGLYFSRIYADRSYVIGARIAEDFPSGMYITAEDPVRSLRATPYEDSQLILFGGDSHKTGQDPNSNIHYRNVLDFANKNFQVKDIPYRWSTQDCMTIDGIPFVGHLTSQSGNIYVATGFNKWGMSNSTAAAMILKDLIVNGANPWAPVYDPHRLTIPSITTLVTQNANVAKELISGKLRPAAENAQIKKGEAAIINVDGDKAGAYRDENGKLHVLDITCTHMGCELAWNNAELSWDCPCHGSRFSYEGQVAEGPALNRLKEIGEGANRVEPNVYH